MWPGEPHFSAGMLHFSPGKGIFWQESCILVGKGMFLQENPFSAVCSGGLRIMNGSLFLDEISPLSSLEFASGLCHLPLEPLNPEKLFTVW